MDRVALLEAIDALLVAARRAAKLRVHRKIEPAFAKALAAFFRSQGRTFLRGFASLKPAFVTEALREADTPGWEAIWTAASAAQRKRLEAVLARYLTQAYRAGAVSSAKALGIAFDLANERAVEWAAGHAATLVSGIEDTTKEALRRIISGALDEGWSYQQTARAIREEFAAFSVARSELIAVTETANAYEQANAEQARSIADSGLDMEKAWATVGDNDVEDTCQSNEDEGWIPMDDAHDSGDSEPPAHPNCVIGLTAVTARSIEAASQRWYEGEVVEICTAAGYQLTCTPNHPVLGEDGWVAAGLLDIGSRVVTSGVRQGVLPRDPDDQSAPSAIREVAHALRATNQVLPAPVPTAPEDFHGDGKGSEVAVVWPNRFLRGDLLHISPAKHASDGALVVASERPVALSSQGGLSLLLVGLLASACRLVRRLRKGRAFFGSAFGDHQPIRVGHVAASSARVPESALDDLPTDPEGLSEPVFGFARGVAAPDLRLVNAGFVPESNRSASRSPMGLQELVELWRVDPELLAECDGALPLGVATDEIVSLDRCQFTGHVYNLQTSSGVYWAGGILVHNCRCTELYRAVGNQAE